MVTSNHDIVKGERKLKRVRLPEDPELVQRLLTWVKQLEPGFYKVGEYGIRHEDLVEVIEVKNSTDHPRARQLVGTFDGRGVIGFRTLTLVPQQRECIDVTLLDQSQLEHVNAYHKRVLDIIGPMLKSRGLDEDHAWLENECQPITV
ncbi:Xaa-Pro aminopeptidase ApepP [Eumeta japonica]|uniref:Xaa-Pro aminopeptidase ApepP n=1 Tax=Eumeta variegata TaxID=151549 RepID=A0A4C1Y2T7_EUMVA|nr:Xaa-Pro aminopeptidase ApepP [Eumeta japonica]